MWLSRELWNIFKHLVPSQLLQAFSFMSEDRQEILPSVRITYTWQPTSQLGSQKFSVLIATSSEELFGPLLNLFITWHGVMTLTSCTSSVEAAEEPVDTFLSLFCPSWCTLYDWNLGWWDPGVYGSVLKSRSRWEVKEHAQTTFCVWLDSDFDFHILCTWSLIRIKFTKFWIIYEIFIEITLRCLESF